MFETYPKGKGSLPKRARARSEETDSVYVARAHLGKGDEVRFRNLGRLDYGKSAQKQNEFTGGIHVSPMRTNIGLGGGLLYGHTK